MMMHWSQEKTDELIQPSIGSAGKRCEDERAWFFREAKKSDSERRALILSLGESELLSW